MIGLRPAVVSGGHARADSSALSEQALFEAELSEVLAAAFHLAAGMLLDRQDAEDAVQEAALRAWRRRSNRKPGTDLKPWFLAIVANQCRETRRGTWARFTRVAEPPDVAVESADRAAIVDLRSALRRLPHRIRLVVVLRFYMDLPFEQVAHVCGCSVDAAKSRTRRGLRALEAALTSTEVSL